MTRWTKPEHYTAKALAWTMMRERGLAPICAPTDDDLVRELFPPTFSLGGKPMDIVHGSFHPPRIRAEWSGHRGGKTELLRNWAIDMASGPDKPVRAKWINGRLWILD